MCIRDRFTIGSHICRYCTVASCWLAGAVAVGYTTIRVRLRSYDRALRVKLMADTEPSHLCVANTLHSTYIMTFLAVIFSVYGIECGMAVFERTYKHSKPYRIDFQTDAEE